jgi:hypothetical protein
VILDAQSRLVREQHATAAALSRKITRVLTSDRHAKKAKKKR